jgi:hypothetical protein
VWSRYVDAPEPRSRVVSLNSRDNPHLPPHYLDALLARSGEHERAAREAGRFGSLEGLVYSAWDRERHLVPCRPLPADWPRYVAIDFGTRNPCAWVLAALDHDDRLWIERLLYAPGLLLSEQVRRFRALCDDAGVPWLSWVEAVADPEDRSSRLTLAVEHDLYTRAANKAIRDGVNSVAERRTPAVDGQPALYVLDHPSTRPIVSEIEGYSWVSTVGEPDKPAKRNDHAMDALRYLCHDLARGEMAVGGAAAG